MTEPKSDLLERLEWEPGDCPFCGRDPYHYEHNGVGMERVAVTCCDEGVALFQHGDPVLTTQIQLRSEAAEVIRVLAAALETISNPNRPPRVSVDWAARIAHQAFLSLNKEGKS